MQNFSGKNYWAVLLGGSSGLGLASAKKLAKEGMNLIIIHRSRKSEQNEIDKHFKEILSYKVQLEEFNSDALNKEIRSDLIEKIKLKSGNNKIRLLLHSISKGNLKPMIDEEKIILNNEDFHLTIDAMAISLYDWTHDLFKAKLFSDDARVISFTSEGNSKAWKNYAAVSAAKSALESITRNIALEFAPYGIRANCIQAGITDTKSFRLIPGSEELASFTKKRNPFKRLTKPEDVADAVFLLTTNEASWINGTIIQVDGGEHLL